MTVSEGSQEGVSRKGSKGLEGRKKKGNEEKRSQPREWSPSTLVPGMRRVIASNSLAHRNIPLPWPLVPPPVFRRTPRCSIVYTASSSQPAQLVRRPLSRAVLTVSRYPDTGASGTFNFFHPSRACSFSLLSLVSLYLVGHAGLVFLF